MSSLAPDPTPFDAQELIVQALLSVGSFPDKMLLAVDIDGDARTFYSPIPNAKVASVAAAALARMHPHSRVLITFGDSVADGVDRVTAIRGLLDEPNTYAFHVTREEWVNVDDGDHGSYDDLRSHPSTLEAAFTSGKILP